MLLAVPFQSSQLPFSSSWRSVGLVPIHAVGVRNEGFFRPYVLGGIYAQIALLLLVHLGNLSPIHGCATAATKRGIHAKIVVLKCTIVAIVVVIIVIVLITEISVGGGHDDTNAKIGLLSMTMNINLCKLQTGLSFVVWSMAKHVEILCRSDVSMWIVKNFSEREKKTRRFGMAMTKPRSYVYPQSRSCFIERR